MAVVTTRGLADSASLRLARGKMFHIFYLLSCPRGAPHGNRFDFIT